MSNQEHEKELLKAMKMNETIRYALLDSDKMSDNQWKPNIVITPNTTGLLVKFFPPYPNADHHEICVLDDLYCIGGGRRRVNKSDNEAFIKGIPSNHYYKILVRPCDVSGEYLDAWFSRGKYFYPHVTTTVKPTNSTMYLNVNAPIKSLQPENYIVIMVVAISISIIALIAFLLGVWFRKKKCFNLNSLKICHQRHRGNQSHSDDVTIIPVFIPNHNSFQNMVTAHLEILKQFDRIKVRDSPFISRSEYIKAMENVDVWIDSQLNSVLNEVNNHIIIYVSDELLSCLQEPRSAESHNEICVRMINKISEILQPRNYKPFVVCFGWANKFTLVPPLTRFKDIKYVVEQKEQCISSSISFEGTEKIIQELLPTNGNYSLSAEETKDLRVKFMRHFHPAQIQNPPQDVEYQENVDYAEDMSLIS